MQWDDLENKLSSFLHEDHDRPLYILSPFINTDYFQELMGNQREVHVITSWRKDHLLTGVSNINLYNIVKRNPAWKLYINDRLHAKVYCRNFDQLLMGSANLTKKALMDTTKSNHEVLVELECSEESSRKICGILQNSILMDDEIFEKYESWYDEQDKTKYSIDTGSVIEVDNINKLFLVSQLPASTSPKRLWDLISGNVDPEEDWNESVAAQHDLDNLKISLEDYSGYSEFRKHLTQMMLNQAFFNAFLSEITAEGMRFGYAKQWIQENCIDNPVPYRKKLTRTIQNLFAWIVELFGETYEVIRPNFSQVIRLKSKSSNDELCIHTGKELNVSWYVSERTFPASGKQYKTCPNCSVLRGELVFYTGRVHPKTEQNMDRSVFGFTPQRISKYNPDGIQTWCRACRSNRDAAATNQRRFSYNALKNKIGNELEISKRANL